MSDKPDTFGAIMRDAARKVTDAVKPHATLDNAVKVLGAVNAALDAVEKARRIKPPRKP